MTYETNKIYDFMKEIILLLIVTIFLIGCIQSPQPDLEGRIELLVKNYRELGYYEGLADGLGKCEDFENKVCIRQEEGSSVILNSNGFSMWELNPRYPSCNQSKEEVLGYIGKIECK